MRALVLAAAAVLLAGHACAQDSGASVCRSFCDADATQCRAHARDLADSAVDPLDPNDFSTHAHPQAPHDDFSAEKKRAVENAAGKDRFAASQKCTSARMACVQRCAAPVVAPAASAP